MSLFVQINSHGDIMQLGVRDVARILNVSEKSIYRWIQQGQLPAYKVNEQYRFNRAELLEWANAQKINVSAEMFTEPDAAAELMPDFADTLEAGGIFYRLEGNDKESALRSAVGVMKLPPDMDRELLLRVLLARESMASTGIGEGIAIPHVRNPIVLSVNHPAICLCFLEKPIEFGAIDDLPVHTLFTLVSPTVRIHLYMLSRLAHALRDPGFKDCVARQGSREEILAAARAMIVPAPKPTSE
jgi:PTS system nitrogen regulatory IIA component